MEIVGCSFDDAASLKSFADEFGFQFRFISDVERRVGLAYGACRSNRDEFPRRIAYLINEEGTILEAHAAVDARSYPRTQLQSLVAAAGTS